MTPRQAGSQPPAPPPLPPGPGPLDADAVLALYQHAGGLRRGHFVLSSGLHSDTYLQSAPVLQWPPAAEALGRSLASRWHSQAAGGPVDVVVGPAMGGVVIGHEVARALGVRMVFTERTGDRGAGGAMALRRSFTVGPGERVLIAENVVTTGGSALEVAELLRTAGAAVAGLVTIIDRLPAGARLPVPFTALARIEAGAWESAACPGCLQDANAETPGSRGRI
ncbi:MAG TPA: orotate phosphoribosyltransferase [Actinomycetota bacterium]